LGGLAFLAVVSVVYLIAAIVGYLASRARARRERKGVPASDDAQVMPEPVVPLGPRPVLESDPFALSEPAPAAPAEPAVVEGVSTPPDEAERVTALLAALERQAELELAPSRRPEPRAQLQPESRIEPQPAPQPELPARPHSEPQPAAQGLASLPPEYRLVAPVELHFTEGGGRIGVRPGTRTHDEFQRLARTLLDELKAARSRGQQ
jgi:hypothetical protein